MSVTRVLARGRRAHLALMRDTVEIKRPTGQTTDPDTGVVTTTYTTVYTGHADVKPQIAGTTDVDAGERRTELRQYDVKLPFTTEPDFQPEDVLTTTASEDANLIGRPLTVIAVGYGSRRTARHLVAEDQEVPQ